MSDLPELAQSENQITLDTYISPDKGREELLNRGLV
jgi:hypothetical protein